jgi:hypothetical protein
MAGWSRKPGRERHGQACDPSFLETAASLRRVGFGPTSITYDASLVNFVGSHGFAAPSHGRRDRLDNRVRMGSLRPYGRAGQPPAVSPEVSAFLVHLPQGFTPRLPKYPELRKLEPKRTSQLLEGAT